MKIQDFSTEKLDKAIRFYGLMAFLEELDPKPYWGEPVYRKLQAKAIKIKEARS